jgi:glycosyltransferase involved in cell wall biosynthesis
VRVAFDHNIFTVQRYGGVSRYIFELASRLPADVVSDVAVVAPMHINYYLSQYRGKRFSRGLYFPYAFRGQVRLTDLVNRIVGPLIWRGLHADIVHETFFAEKPVGQGRKRVVTVYDMIHELFPAEFTNAPQMAAALAAKRAAVARADHVICISESTRRDLIRLYDLNPERTSVVYLGHSMTVDHAVSDEAEVGTPRKPVILYVGHRHGYKNFGRLIQAYASSPLLRAEFEIRAIGSSPFDATEIAEMERLGIREKVSHQSVTDAELIAHYKSATVFVYPSLYEGFGIPPLEAMSCGCPVACSDGGSIPEVVGEAGLYFNPLEIEQIRAVMERIVTSPSLQAELRASGYARIRNFSWDKCAADTARVYSSLLG